MDQKDFASAAALFKNPVPSHGPKRNTACHQCRKRKLKCDTQRPCSTCVRSHAYAVAHATEGQEVPDEPECTYGDLPKESPSQSKVEKLENRIGELEGLLQQMQLALEASQQQNTPSNHSTPAPSFSDSPSSSRILSPEMSGLLSDPSPFNGANGTSSSTATDFMAASPASFSINSSLYDDAFSPATALDLDAAGFAQFALSDSMGVLAQLTAPSLSGAIVPHSSSSSHDRRTQLLLMGWPLHLPEPDLTRHLVHAFFAFNMHAGRLFHGPTFLASLDLAPTDPRFPFSGLLHAICAVGSMYTADIPQPPVLPRTTQYPPSGQFFAVDELFPGRWRQYDQRPDSFAEQQIKFARLAGEAALDRGEHLLDALQTMIILTWFYMIQARWSEAYLSSGETMRSIPPCGINTSPPFHGGNPSTLNRLEGPASILPDPQTIIEHEMRRNIFWIAYASERAQAAGNGFAMMLDDMDICQLLPLRGDQYEQGIEVPDHERQWSHDRSTLLVHTPNQTDSFILYIKSTILLSLVKNFNLRFRARFFAGDTAMSSPSSSPIDRPETFDPIDTPAFQELDHIVTSFRSSFPPHLRNPVQDDMLDAYLYSASCAGHLSQVLFHEPHARMTSMHDISRTRVMRGARAILQLMYAINATSFDISLLDHLPILSWHVCGRVLVRALKATIDMKDFEQMMVLQNEVNFVHSMLAKAGERMPLAHRYKKMIYDLLASTCGRDFVASLPETSYHRPPQYQPFNASYNEQQIMGYSLVPC